LPAELNKHPIGTDRLLGELRDTLAQLKPSGLLRELRVVSCAGPMITAADGKELVNFTSNSYLGLNEHPEMKRAVVQAVEAYGTGSGASLLISGRGPIHEQAELAFAKFKHAEAALLLPTGYMANLAVLTALAGPGDLVCLDKLCHASLIDAAHASGAEVRTFPHLTTDKLRRLLARHVEKNTPGASDKLIPHVDDDAGGLADDQNSSRARKFISRESHTLRNPRRFIVTDSVFSMDGDCADLPGLCDLADEFEAVMMVDEAHGTGVLGESGSGLCEAQGVLGRVDVTVSTASKALGSMGGMITAARPIIDTIINHARPLIYTTAIPPAQAAAILKAVELVEREPECRQRLRTLTLRLRDGLKKQGWDLPPQGEYVTPIVPLIVGKAKNAVALSDHLYANGLAAPAIRPPTVATGSSRVRLSLRADMEDEHIDHVLKIIGPPCDKQTSM
jgi:8-amino-7-oxononanoate synthase